MFGFEYYTAAISRTVLLLVRGPYICCFEDPTAAGSRSVGGYLIACVRQSCDGRNLEQVRFKNSSKRCIATSFQPI